MVENRGVIDSSAQVLSGTCRSAIMRGGGAQHSDQSERVDHDCGECPRVRKNRRARDHPESAYRTHNDGDDVDCAICREFRFGITGTHSWAPLGF